MCQSRRRPLPQGGETTNNNNDDAITQKMIPLWIPRRGEQLCNLVGDWRILQRVGSHRWTTDDLMTAVVASKVIEQRYKLLTTNAKRKRQMTDTIIGDNATSSHTSSGLDDNDDDDDNNTFRYLDLGCGNGSVLSMTCWKLSQILAGGGNHEELLDETTTTTKKTRENTMTTTQREDFSFSSSFSSIDAIGIEARKEAVELNRRSLSFNVGYYHHDKHNDTNQVSCHDKCKDRKPDDESPLDHGTTTATTTEQTRPTFLPINVEVIHGDFRECISSTSHSSNSQLKHKLKKPNSFHLITGTPPYFRVDFHVKQQDESGGSTSGGDVIEVPGVVSKSTATSTTPDATTTTTTTNTSTTSAVIRQGGMPTNKQSAPARCEFRGGIEAYCEVAALYLRRQESKSSSYLNSHHDDDDDDPPGYFVVCENWANHERVLQSAMDAGLQIVSIQPIKGSVRKQIPLFAVYTMILQSNWNHRSIHTSSDGGNFATHEGAVVDNGNHKHKGNQGGSTTTDTSFTWCPTLSVRNADGTWTIEYARMVLEYMSIPAMHNVSELC